MRFFIQNIFMILTLHLQSVRNLKPSWKKGDWWGTEMLTKLPSLLDILPN